MRSPVRSARAPALDARDGPGTSSTASPSATSASKRDVGSSARKTASAAGEAADDARLLEQELGAAGRRRADEAVAS